MISSVNEYLTKLPRLDALCLTAGAAFLVTTVIEKSLSAIAQKILNAAPSAQATCLIKTVAVISGLGFASMIAPKALMIGFTAQKIFEVLCIVSAAKYAYDAIYMDRPGTLTGFVTFLALWNFAR